jgi:hypothetical protein
MRRSSIGATGDAGAAHPVLRGLAAFAICLSLAACSGGGSLASSLPSFPDDLGGTPSDDFIPTFPPDDLASGVAACIDPPTMAVIDQLRAPGADVEAILTANEDALVAGLGELESADPRTTEWRDALLTALTADDMARAAAQVAVLAAGNLTITPC